MSMSMNIGLVDDHSLIRDSLKLILEKLEKKDFYISIEAENGKDLIKKLKKVSEFLIPKIILLDINMPEMDGFETADWLRINYPDIRIIVLTMHEDENSILRMLRLGVKGYLGKNSTPDELIGAIKAVSNGGQSFSTNITSMLISSLQNKNLPNHNDQLNSLTEKEFAFIKLTCTDLTYQEIAKKMGLSIRTIDGYRESVFSKLGVNSRSGLIIYAIKNGIVKV